ncbi:MAG: methyltransferase domain-containing protein [Acidobacteria bacterium]|nr:methyltransferase domain-containing protein [Acidobacteriota bacterium]
MNERIHLICPVRACGSPLSLVFYGMRCPSGHTFDLARSGYVNLLQPQDSKSREPGDSREAVAARRRMIDRGFAKGLASVIAATLGAQAIGAGCAILDAGCGEGFHLADACAQLGTDGCGIDISTPAIEIAAKRHRKLVWIVANADRAIPLANGSIDAVLSITARTNRDEFARIVKPGGFALVAVAAPDDLAELRHLVLGESLERDRVARVVEGLAPRFALVSRERCVETLELDRASLDDLLAATYRGQRNSQREALEGVERMTVTSSRELLLLRRIES